ncbi:MAG: hypothetical protein AAGF95_27070 [Chloroflexota bacterium]
MQLNKDQIQDHLITKFLDVTNLEWHLWRDAYEDSLTPMGYDSFYALRLMSRGSCGLCLCDHDGYTSIQVSSLIVQGEWHLCELHKDRFAIQIIAPRFEIIRSGGDLNTYIQAIEAQQCWFVDVNSAGFRDCPKQH